MKRASPAGSRIIGLPNEAIREGHPVHAPLLCPLLCANSTATFDFRLGTAMADHSEVAYTTADGMDYPAHEATYEGFINLVKYGTGTVALILILMAIFLT